MKAKKLTIIVTQDKETINIKRSSTGFSIMEVLDIVDRIKNDFNSDLLNKPVTITKSEQVINWLFRKP